VRRVQEGLAPRRDGPAPVGAGVRLEGTKVLLADDDMRTVYALSATLRSKGVTVLVADTGAAALATLDAHPEVDAVLMDIMMPEMDGYEATRRIRKQERFGAIPIIALTAKAMKGDRERCLEAGATDYLPKPVDADRLLRMLHDLVRPSRQAGARTDGA
jgi:CheY-like chemotaxis protein